MSVSQYRFGGLTVERAQQICDATRAAIKAVQAGGMRSPDPAVRLATIRMPLNGETYEDRMRAERRLRPVVDAHEREQLDAYNSAIADGASHAVAHAEALQLAKPLRDKHERAMTERRRKLDALAAENRRRKLDVERAAAQKAGYR
jgi:hypothetical protein